jgi:hypothetical protein
LRSRVAFALWNLPPLDWMASVGFKVGRNDQIEVLPSQVHRSGGAADGKECDGSAGKQEKRTDAQQHDQAS